MREIKFRAWQKGGTKMIDLQKITPLILSHDQDGVFLPFHKDIYIMQYTGLKDKNGVEIYEGDILSFVPAGSMLFNHPYAPFVVSWVEKEARFTDWSPRDRVEIIGNVFENPELVDK